MDKFREIALPLVMAVMMSVARNLKSGKVKIGYLVAEGCVAFCTGYLGYYVFTIWLHYEIHIACGFCGFLGFFSRDIVENLDPLIDTIFKSIKKLITKKIEE